MPVESGRPAEHGRLPRVSIGPDLSLSPSERTSEVSRATSQLSRQPAEDTRFELARLAPNAPFKRAPKRFHAWYLGHMGWRGAMIGNMGSAVGSQAVAGGVAGPGAGGIVSRPRCPVRGQRCWAVSGAPPLRFLAPRASTRAEPPESTRCRAAQWSIAAPAGSTPTASPITRHSSSARLTNRPLPGDSGGITASFRPGSAARRPGW